MLRWPNAEEMPGGCPILGAASELDARPGPARDLLVNQQKDWSDTVAQVVRTAVAQGHFREGVDPEQFAYELRGIDFAHHHARFLLRDPKAEARTRTAFEALMARAQS
jgi:hypothetical protein